MKPFLGAVGVVALLVGAALPAQAWVHGHHGFHGRVVIVGAPWPFWYYPPPYYAYSSPPVVVQDPPVYVQRSVAAAPPGSTWYYCASAKGYYPTVPTCSQAWVRVPPAGY